MGAAPLHGSKRSSRALWVSSAGLVSAAPRVSSEAVARELSGHRVRTGLVEQNASHEDGHRQELGVGPRLEDSLAHPHTGHDADALTVVLVEAIGSKSKGLFWLKLKFPG
jgi:hypothetical protein